MENSKVGGVGENGAKSTKRARGVQRADGAQATPHAQRADGVQSPQGIKRRKTRARRVRKALKVHPLFLLLGVYYCFIGELPLFLLSALVALQHECAHAFAAAKLGYRLDRVVLMPYGAVIDGDLSGISFKDEIFVAVWGPLCNLVTAAGFAALWWIYPTAYAFTDTACYVSLAVALVNLIPAYPLDGGRVLRAALAMHFDEKKVNRICRGITLVLAAGLLAAFVTLCVRKTPNFTLLAFSLFLAVGAFGNPKNDDAKYRKINFSSKAAFRRGVEIRRVAVEETCSLKRAVGFIEQGRYLILDVYDQRENYLGEIRQDELAEIFSQAGIYEPIGDFL